MRALTAFLERELLALLLDAPQANGGGDGSEESESQSQSQSQSQTAPPTVVTLSDLSRPRVVAVSRARPAEQRLALVDRTHALDAFVSHHALALLGSSSDASALVSLRGSVVRIERYHFATSARVAALAHSAAQWAAPSARVCLWIDELSVIDKSGLAVNVAPAADESASVAALLQELDDAQLETRLAARQALPPLPAPPVVTRFDDAHPLQDEDCVIPADQEAQLEAQDGWGLPAANQPTDSQLIAENESGSWTPSQSQLLVGDAARAAPIARSAAMDADAAEAQGSGEESEAPVDRDDGESVTESQGFQFQPEDVSKTFIHCSDTESDSDAASGPPSQICSGSRRQRESTSQDAVGDAAAGDPNVVVEEAERANHEPVQQLVVPTSEQLEQVDAEPIESHNAEAGEELPSESQAIADALLIESQQESTQLADDFGFQIADVDGAPFASQASQGDFVPDVNGEGGFPQTQAPDTQDRFAVLDDETTDATESQTQMPLEEMEAIRVDALQEDAEPSGEVEEIVIDESEETEPLAKCEQQEQHQQPLTQLPDSADEKLVAITPPRSRKRTRGVTPANGEREATSTPPKTPVVIVIPDTPVSFRTRKASCTTARSSPSRRTRQRTAEGSPVSQTDEQPAATSVSALPVTAPQLAQTQEAAASEVSMTLQPAQEASPRPSAKPSAPSQEVAPRQPKSLPRARDAAASSATKSLKASRAVSSPRQSNRSPSPAAEATTRSAAELAIKSYFRTGVPFSIQQRVQQPRDEEFLDFFRRPAEEAVDTSRNRNGRQPRAKQSSTAGRWYRTERGVTGVL